MPLPRPGFSGDLFDRLERWTVLAWGTAEMVSGYSASTLHSTVEQQPVDATALGTANWSAVAGIVPDVLAHVGWLAFDAIADTAVGVEQGLGKVAQLTGVDKLSQALAIAVYAGLADLAQAHQQRKAQRTEMAATFMGRTAPATLQEALTRIDLNALLAEVDVNELIARVDMDLVMDQIDFNEVLSRVDMEELIQQLNLNEIISASVAQIEVSGLLRDSTGALAQSTVGALANQVGGLTNRLTGRNPA